MPSKPEPKDEAPGIWPPVGTTRDDDGRLIGPDGKPLEEDDAQA